MVNCTINNCKYEVSKANIRRGMCPYHYRDWRIENAGSFETVEQRRKPRHAIIDGDIAKIPLGVDAKDGYAIVDADMAYLADEHKFALATTGYGQSSHVKHVKIHHLIVGYPKKGYVVDHINRNRLDNRRVNLRTVTASENAQNAKGQPNASGYKGVAMSRNRWRAYIKPYGKQLSLGVYATAEEAAKAYDKAAKEYWGEYAYLNFPEG